MPIAVSPTYLKLMPAASARSRTADAVAPGTPDVSMRSVSKYELVQLPVAQRLERRARAMRASVWTRVAIAFRPCGPW